MQKCSMYFDDVIFNDDSVTKWLDYLLNIWPYTTIKFVQQHYKFAKVDLKFCDKW